ncbi:MAG: hypothetical protein WBO68_14155, partial [Pyrinomonadaceae bacterium]
IYFTMGKKTDPTTAALTIDANSLPVQPINPATGAQEDGLMKMIGDTDASLMLNANSEMIPPGTLPGGDGYNPWANGGAPPIGAPPIGAPQPQMIPQGGQVVTIDPNSPSQFMPNEGGIILVPIPANTTPDVKPTPTPRSTAGNTTVQQAPTTTATPKPMATPPPKTPKTTDKPKDKVPAAKTGQSGETGESPSGR